jgi:transcriptional regulator with XRE-family HTH domain
MMSDKLPEGRQLGYQFGSRPGETDPIWELIREERLNRRLTIEQVGALAGVAGSTVSRGERGYEVWLSKTRVVAQALGITIATITTPHQGDGDIE